jgi:flagellar hook-associated protein 2
MQITAPGIGTGLDIKSLVEQLVAAERQPLGRYLNLREAKANAQLSAYGKLKSALATFRDALAGLSSLDKFQKRTATVTPSAILSAAPAAAAAPGSYDIEVLALASTHKLVSTPFASADTVVGAGTLAVTINGEAATIEIAAGSTLADIRDAINDAADNPGVRASIVTADDGAHLLLTSMHTGADHAIGIDAVQAGSPLEAFEFGAGTTNSMTQLAAAQDASIEIDGLAVRSAGNSISGAIEGVTLNLLEAEPGTTVKLNISNSATAVEEAVDEFVKAYNALMKTVSELTAYDPETRSAGTLINDPLTRGLKTSLRQALSSVVEATGASFHTLAEIGITTDSDGELLLNRPRLDAAIAGNFDAVGRLFADADKGVAVRMDAVLDRLIDTDGRIPAREQTIKSQLERIRDRQENLDLRMEVVRKRYERQFAAMDTLVAQLNQTSAFIAQQLSRTIGQ